MRFRAHREVSLLLAQLRRFASLAANKQLALVGSSLYEYKVLLRLVHDGETSQNELGVDAAMDKAAVSRLVRTLAAQGVVSVRVDAADRRQRLVRVTDKGRAKEAMLSPIVDDALAPYMQGLTAKEMDQLLRLLRKSCEACLRVAREQALAEPPREPERKGRRASNAKQHAASPRRPTSEPSRKLKASRTGPRSAPR